MKHQRHRCLSEMPSFHIHNKLQLLYLFAQQSQCRIINTVLGYANQKPFSADHNSTGRVYNAQYSPCILNTSEIASIACLHNFSGPALPFCSEILTYQLLGSQLYIAKALPLKNSRSPATAMIEIVSIACLHKFFRHALLSCSEILTYQLLSS